MWDYNSVMKLVRCLPIVACFALTQFLWAQALASSTAPDEVVVWQVDSSAFSQLSPAEQGSVRVRLVGKVYKRSRISEAADAAREVLQNLGFFAVQTGGSIIEPLGASGQATRVCLRLDLSPGPRYRLKEVRWAGVRAFPIAQVEQLVPMQPGDVPDVSKIRAVLEAVHRLYVWGGYPNMTVRPNTTVDAATQTLAILFDVDEGRSDQR